MRIKDFGAECPGKLIRNLQGQFNQSLAMHFLNLTYPSAQNNVQKLVAAGILEEITPKTMPARFIARAILKAVSPEPSQQ